MASGSVEELRALAQSFTERPKAIFVAALEKPPSLLYAVSADRVIDAGKALRKHWPKPGDAAAGMQRLAQGSVPDAALLDKVLAVLVLA